MSDFRFESTEMLFWLWIIPILLFTAILFSRRAQRQLSRTLGEKLRPFLTSSVSHEKRKWKLGLELFVLTLLIFAYARPQSSEGRQQVKNEGIEIVFLVDVSNSMMAEDVRPSRLQLAKSEMERLIDASPGDRMSLIAFAGSAVMLSPMTTDGPAIKMFIESLTPDAVLNQGTNFSKALSEAKEAFRRGGMGDLDDAQVTRAILIVSDGEDHEVGAYEVAKDLAKEGIHIFTMAVGTEAGGPLPIYDENGNLRGHRLDRDNRPVISKTKGTVLKELAKIGQGSFHHLTFQGDSIAAIRKDIDQLKRTQFESGEISSYNENYQWLLIAALIFALMELLLGERRAKSRIWKGRFEVEND